MYNVFFFTDFCKNCRFINFIRITALQIFEKSSKIFKYLFYLRKDKIENKHHPYFGLTIDYNVK